MSAEYEPQVLVFIFISKHDLAELRDSEFGSESFPTYRTENVGAGVFPPHDHQIVRRWHQTSRSGMHVHVLKRRFVRLVYAYASSAPIGEAQTFIGITPTSLTAQPLAKQNMTHSAAIVILLPFKEHRAHRSLQYRRA